MYSAYYFIALAGRSRPLVAPGAASQSTCSPLVDWFLRRCCAARRLSSCPRSSHAAARSPCCRSASLLSFSAQRWRKRESRRAQLTTTWRVPVAVAANPSPSPTPTPTPAPALVLPSPRPSPNPNQARAKARQEANIAANAAAAEEPQPGKVSYKQSQSSAGVPASFKQMVQKSVAQREAMRPLQPLTTRHQSSDPDPDPCLTPTQTLVIRRPRA